MNQLVTTNNKVPFLGEPISKIDIGGYTLDNYKTFHPESYSLLCRFGETCDGLSFFPNTSKIVLNTSQQSKLIHNFEQLVPSIAADLGVSEQVAFEKSVDFFSNTKITVQPTGIQGKVYKTMQSVQNYVPMSYTSKAVSLLKTTGMTGFEIISNAPLIFVGVTYIGSIFFGYCGSIAGNNPVGLIFNSTSFVLSRPMRAVEITLNGLILTPISNTIGLPLILNGTQKVLSGKGVSLEEYTKIAIAFERINNSRVIKKAKKIYRIIRDRNE